MNKKKILIIGSIPPPYHGVTLYNSELIKSKISSYFNIYHFDISDKRGLDNIGNLDLTNITLGLKNFYGLFKVIIRLKPDLVYLPIAQNIAYLRDGIFIMIINFFCEAKIVIHLHGSYFKCYYNESNWFIKKFIDFTLRKVDTAIVLGNSLKNILDKWVNNIEVVPNGVFFNSNIKRKYYKNNKEIIVSYLGNLLESKGVFTLVKASKIVLKKYNNVKFRFAGSWWSQEKEFKSVVFEFIRENQIINSIQFIGTVLNGEKEKFLIETDIFIFPSINEGQPFVILEAMAAGCPVISTENIGAIPETVIDGETGILVEKKNPKAIADAIIYLIEHPDERIKMGLAGRKRFKANYTFDKSVDNLIKVFNNILADN